MWDALCSDKVEQSPILPFSLPLRPWNGWERNRTVNFTCSFFSRGLTVGMCVSANENLPNGHIVVLARFLPFNFQSTTFP